MALCGVDLPCFTKPVIESRNGLDIEDEEPIEIDYDSTELTMLYQAIEDKAFMAAIDFLESGKPEVYDEVRTWITRYDQMNRKKIRWSQLPIHAAIVFGGPPRLIELLVEIYPKGVRCTDDRVMLPVHLAFRKESCDAILHCLLSKFPESINAKDSRGRTPLQVKDSQKTEIIKMYEDNAKMRARKALTDEKVSAVQERLTVADELNSNLQNKNETLDDENKALKEQLAKVEQDLAELRTSIASEKALAESVTPTETAATSGAKKSVGAHRKASFAERKAATVQQKVKAAQAAQAAQPVDADTATRSTVAAANTVAVQPVVTTPAKTAVTTPAKSAVTTPAKSAMKTEKNTTKKVTFFKKLFGGRKRKTASTKSASAMAPVTVTMKDDEKEPTVDGSDDEREKQNPAEESDAVVVETVKDESVVDGEAVLSEQAPAVVEPVAQ